MRKFKLMNQHAIFFGVCSGIAYALGLPTWIIRVLFVFISPSLIPYLILAILVPSWKEDPKDYEKICE